MHSIWTFKHIWINFNNVINKKSFPQTGPSYGRKMMTGYLAAKGVKASEGRVGKVLRTIHQPYHTARQQVKPNSVSVHVIVTYWEFIHTNDHWVFTIFFRVPETLTRCLTRLSTWVTKSTLTKMKSWWCLEWPMSWLLMGTVRRLLGTPLCPSKTTLSFMMKCTGKKIERKKNVLNCLNVKGLNVFVMSKNRMSMKVESFPSVCVLSSDQLCCPMGYGTKCG